MEIERIERTRTHGEALMHRPRRQQSVQRVWLDNIHALRVRRQALGGVAGGDNPADIASRIGQRRQTGVQTPYPAALAVFVRLAGRPARL